MRNMVLNRRNQLSVCMLFYVDTHFWFLDILLIRVVPSSVCLQLLVLFCLFVRIPPSSFHPPAMIQFFWHSFVNFFEQEPFNDSHSIPTINDVELLELPKHTNRCCVIEINIFIILNCRRYPNREIFGRIEMAQLLAVNLCMDKVYILLKYSII